MRKTAKIDFFTVSIQDDSADLEQILRDLHSKPADSSRRNVEINDGFLRLARGSLTDSGYLGDMMRISMVPPGFRATIKGKVTPIDLNQDEGTADFGAFYYDFESSILVLQRNSKAVTWKQFGTYIQNVADVDGEVEVKPVLRPTDIDRVKVLSLIRKVHISSAIVDVMPTLDNIDEQTRRVIQNAVEAESPEIEIILKSGREKGATLNQAVAIETLESWLRIHSDFADAENEIVKKIVIGGRDEAGGTTEFDLLKDKMFVPFEFEWIPDDEELWKKRSQHIQKAWDLNKSSLIRILNREP